MHCQIDEKVPLADQCELCMAETREFKGSKAVEASFFQRETFFLTCIPQTSEMWLAD